MSEETENLSDGKTIRAELAQVESIETLKQALAEEGEKAEKYLANWQRAQADLINYKKRAEQEKNEMVEFANSTLTLNLMTIMDDWDRAFVSLPAQLTESSWTEGIRLIYNKLKAVLEAQGLTEIKAKGEPFDPSLHEAVMYQEGEEGKVVEEIQRGYKFKDRVIRPSMVIVGEGSEEEKTEQESQKEK